MKYTRILMGLFLMYFCLFGYFFLYKRTYSYMDEFIRISYKYGVDVNNKFIKNISNGLSVFEFLNDINILDEKSIEIKILSNDIEKHENDIIATGDSLVIYQNGIMKDLSVLQEAPFTDRGSISQVFTDISVWTKIRGVIEWINSNAAVA